MSDIDTAAADSLKALDLEWPIREVTQSSGKVRYVTFFRDTAVKLPVKRIIVGPADGADERSHALSRRLQ